MEEMRKQIGKRFRVAIENYQDPTKLFFHNGVLKEVDQHGIWLETEKGTIYLSFEMIRQATYDETR